MKKRFSLLALFLFACLLFNFYPEIIDRFDSSQVQNPANNSRIRQAFENRQSDVQVRGEGTVVAILSDDTKGSRHQRFIVKLSPGQTVLIAHNIDLAPRIDALAKGDAVEFYGEYEWTEKGGVIHWTHHDPRGRHEDGWIVHRGRKYGQVRRHPQRWRPQFGFENDVCKRFWVFGLNFPLARAEHRRDGRKKARGLSESAVAIAKVASFRVLRASRRRAG